MPEEETFNHPPVISSVTDSPDPLNSGGQVTFSVVWGDPDIGQDLTKIHICKTDAISGGSCSGGSWCDSSSWSGSSPTECSYLTTESEIGIQDYYAFVCDDDTNCSTSMSGTFTVKAPPSIQLIQPNGSQYFNGIYQIDFNVRDLEGDELHLKIGYSKGSGGPRSIADSFTNTSKIASDSNVEVDTANGRVTLQPDNEGWWNNDWSHRKKATIDNSSGGALTDYQVLVEVDYNTAMNKDYSDLRFIDPDTNTELSYWIENDYNKSCYDIHQKDPEAESGLYYIKPDGVNQIQVYCDMNISGGGWTAVLVSNQGVTGCPAPTWANVVSANNLNGTMSSTLTAFDQFLGVKYWELLGDSIMLEMGASPTSLSHRAFYDFSLNESNNYVLSMSNENVTIHTEGTASSGLYTYSAANSYQLSSYDADHDVHSGNCSTSYCNAPWWYGACWSGNYWGGCGCSHQNAPFWTGSGTEYFAYGSAWVKGESYTSQAKVWVKVPSIPSASDKNIYVYYGNSSAASNSNGEAVFDFFDDFNGSSIDTSKWTITDATGWSVTNDTLKGTNTTGRITSQDSFSNPVIQEVKAQTVSYATNGQTTAGFFTSTSDSFGFNDYTNPDYIRNDGDWPSSGADKAVANYWNLLRITAEDSSTVNLYIYDLGTATEKYNTDFTNTVSNEKIALGKRYDDAYTGQTYEAYWDWIRTRQYASTEPTVSLAGTVDEYPLYYEAGQFISTNLTNAMDVNSIDSFGYTASLIPAATTLKLQFSQNNSTWFNSSGTQDTWNTLSQGSDSISLSDLNWSSGFYYKAAFTGDGTSSAMLNSISLSIDQNSDTNAFANIIIADLNLNDHANIADLNCVDTNWLDWTNCTYDWNSATIADGNYYLDLNVWDTGDLNAQDRSDSSFYVDNTAPFTIFIAPLGWQTADFNVALECTDEGVGCYATRYRIDLGAWNLFGTPTAWWNSGWLGRRKVTFNNLDQPAKTNQSVLLRLNSGNFDFSQAQAAGQDIRFRDSNQDFALDYFFDEFSASAEKAVIWVKVSSIDANSASNYMWMYYDNNTASDGQSSNWFS